MIFFTYLKFTFRMLLRKWSIWIFSLLYILFAFVFLFLAPMLSDDMGTLDIWQNSIIAPQTMLLIVASILGALVSISIFKDNLDNGSELLLVSKSINRYKIILVKLIVILFFLLLFSITTSFVSFFILLTPDTGMNMGLVNSLFWSLFIATFLACFILTFFGAIISLFANKIWTILISVILTVGLTIISSVVNLTIKSPSDIAKDEQHAIVSTSYLGTDGNRYSIAGLSPFETSDDQGYSSVSIKFNNIDQEKEYYDQKRKQSAIGLRDTLDIMGQFQNLNNMFDLSKRMQENSSHDFGGNHWYSYELDDEPIIRNKDKEPMFYVNTPNMKIFSDIDTFEKLIAPENTQKLIDAATNIIMNQNIVTIGTTDADATSLLSTIADREFYAIETIDGYSSSRRDWHPHQYQGFAVHPYDGSTKDKLFRAMLNAQLGVKQKQTTPGYDGIEVNDMNVDNNAQHWWNFFTFMSDLEKIENWKQEDGATSLPSGLEQLFSPNHQWKESYKIDPTNDPSFEYLFKNSTPDELAKIKDFFDRRRDIPMDFPHFCFVGANNPNDFNLTDNQTYRIRITDPDEEDKFVGEGHIGIGKLLYDDASDEEALSGLNRIMAQYKLFAFEYLTNYIKHSEIQENPNITNVYDGAYNTKFQISQMGVDFASSPLLPIKQDDQHQYSIIDQIEQITPLSGLGSFLEIIFSLCPNLINDPLVSSSAEFVKEWKEIWGNAYFTNPGVLSARALLPQFTWGTKWGWTDARNFNVLDQQQAYSCNLLTTSGEEPIIRNFPVIYENLSTTYKVTPYVDTWVIAGCWFIVGFLLLASSIIIYMRLDFK